MGVRGGGGGGRAWGGDLIAFVGPRVGNLTDLVLPGEGYLNLSSPDVGGMFACRLGRKWLRPNMCFPVSTLLARDVWAGKIWKVMEANENKPKVSGFHCIDQLNLLKILWYQSKRK